eukprot:COSAG03_NODE_2734_length_2490_cov_1739.109996_4_plen_84_part_00
MQLQHVTGRTNVSLVLHVCINERLDWLLHAKMVGTRIASYVTVYTIARHGGRCNSVAASRGYFHAPPSNGSRVNPKTIGRHDT